MTGLVRATYPRPQSRAWPLATEMDRQRAYRHLDSLAERAQPRRMTLSGLVAGVLIVAVVAVLACWGRG